MKNEPANLSGDSPESSQWLTPWGKTGRTQDQSPACCRTAVQSTLHIVLWISSCMPDQNHWNSSEECRHQIFLLCRHWRKEKYIYICWVYWLTSQVNNNFLSMITSQTVAFRPLPTCKQWFPKPRWGYQAGRCCWRLFVAACSSSAMTAQAWKHATKIQECIHQEKMST